MEAIVGYTGYKSMWDSKTQSIVVQLQTVSEVHGDELSWSDELRRETSGLSPF